MNVEDLFLSNEMSANRARQLLEDSVVADTRHAKKLLKDVLANINRTSQGTF